MQLFRFDQKYGKSIDDFGSVDFVLVNLLRLTGDTKLRCAYLGAGGVIGYHQTTTDQLLVVVQGEGWVRGDSQERVPIGVGMAAFWKKDEWHATETELGMTAIIVEGEELNPSQFMPSL